MAAEHDFMAAEHDSMVSEQELYAASLWEEF